MNPDAKPDLKARLIARATDRRRLSASASAPIGQKEATVVEDRHTRFDTLPGYQQIQLIRQGAAQFGVPDPFFKLHQGNAGATTRIGDREYINFASYNYLGLSGDPRIKQAGIDALERYGSSVSASRMVSGERPVHQALERGLAEAYGVDDAVVFVSGHAANVSTIGYLLGARDLILHDEYIHNSSLIGAQLSGARRMSFAHNDPDALTQLLIRHRGQFERVLIIIEGLYSMDGDTPDLARFVEIKQRHRAWLMVDEAHSFGVLGSTGRGLHESCNVAVDQVDIWMGTLSKSLCGCGGYIAGSQPLIDTLRYLAPGFLYSVGMPAQVAAPSLRALSILFEEPERLQRLKARSSDFLRRAREAGLNTGDSIGMAVVPIILGSSLVAARVSDTLFKAGINVQPILYPAVPEKSARLRFFFSCDHTEAQIERTLDVLVDALARERPR
ncbi:aminotransferase class I/II-fold pyridoxal phosphate-dependent enzyme [Salinicola avicenniae]|uniref:aminotransferase class I/II-fold pyridoxal phosphate-dependent enzyme n=1 Tax=Salinicola avicenniae TaxID=2916836 RepID=UPI002072E9C8|nr:MULTISPECIES: aminotransferase class I/II-fold pyridoxal phosphate-dependent enzyme [unclassified Salinicola]